MDSGSKTLVMLGSVLLGILVVLAGMFIFNIFSNKTTNALNEYSTDEATAFNSQFEVYEGRQKGSGVSSLLKKMIVTANTNKDNPDKMASFIITNQINKSATQVENIVRPEDTSKVTDYIKDITSMLSLIEDSHEYMVEINYGGNGLISEFLVTY